MTTAVHFDSVTKRFGELVVVDDVSMRIDQGSVVALLGPNGAGKTTSLDMLLGLTAPTSGSVEVLGGAPRGVVKAGRVSAVLQSGGLLRDLYVQETVELISSTFTDPISTGEALERAGITAIARRKVSKCSGGEQQRLRFALALLPDPELLVLDEPTSGMDVTARQEFWATMHAEAAEGRSIIFATHYLEEANTFAQRIVMMAEGQIVADGTTRDIRTTVRGKTVSAAVPDPDAVAAALAQAPGVHQVGAQGTRVVAHTSDADALALTLLTTYGGEDLEILPGSLDEAFIALTKGTRE